MTSGQNIFDYLHANRWKVHRALCRNLYFMGNVVKRVGIHEEGHLGILLS